MPRCVAESSTSSADCQQVLLSMTHICSTEPTKSLILYRTAERLHLHQPTRRGSPRQEQRQCSAHTAMKRALAIYICGSVLHTTRLLRNGRLWRLLISTVQSTCKCSTGRRSSWPAVLCAQIGSCSGVRSPYENAACSVLLVAVSCCKPLLF